MIRPTPALRDLEARLAHDAGAAPAHREALAIQEALRREAERFGAWGAEEAGLEGDLALARALRGLPPS